MKLCTFRSKDDYTKNKYVLHIVDMIPTEQVTFEVTCFSSGVAAMSEL